MMNKEREQLEEERTKKEIQIKILEKEVEILDLKIEENIMLN